MSWFLAAVAAAFSFFLNDIVMIRVIDEAIRIFCNNVVKFLNNFLRIS